MMKRFFVLLLAIVMLFSFAACGQRIKEKDDDNDEERTGSIIEEDDDESKSEGNNESNAEINSVTKVETNSGSNSEINNDSEINGNTEENTPVIDVSVIDPFAGISYTITGISPYCQISVNNAGCSLEAQKYVTYTLDKEKYANGENAEITATLAEYTDGKEYTLTRTKTTFAVVGQPEYLTSLEGVDLSFLNQELEGYMNAKTAEAVGNWGLFGIHATGNSYSTYRSIEKVEQKEVYFTSVKKIKEHSDIDFYNSLNLVYAIDATMAGGSINGSEACVVYVDVIAYNVVKYPDGTVKWGITDPDSYEFKSEASTESVNYMVTTCVTVQSADYNITKVK